jgi:hypothetical protein
MPKMSKVPKVTKIEKQTPEAGLWPQQNTSARLATSCFLKL